MNSFEKIKKMREEYQAVIKNEGEKAISELVKAFFETAGGKFNAVRWRQYTPFFNDGDACEFSVHGVYFRTSDTPVDAEEGGDYDDGFESPWGFKSTYGGKTPQPELFELASNFEAELNQLEDVLLMCFGDHVMVTATADKVEVEEYSHD